MQVRLDCRQRSLVFRSRPGRHSLCGCCLLSTSELSVAGRYTLAQSSHINSVTPGHGDYGCFRATVRRYGLISLLTSPVRLCQRTCSGSSHNSKLASYVDNAAPVSQSTVMRWQWFLLQHLLDLCARGQPTAAVINAVDLIKVLGRSLVRSLIVTQYASTQISFEILRVLFHSRMEVPAAFKT